MTNHFVKPINALMTGYSFLDSSVTGKLPVHGMPASISAELTNNCNLHCPECASGSGIMKRERGLMNLVLYKKLIRELRPFLYSVNLYFQGEPMLHPGFFLFIENAENVRTVVSTNGHFLTAENSEKIVLSGLRKLIISLDGMDQDVYSEYRREGDLNKVMDGIKNIVAARKRYSSEIKLEIQFLVNKKNEDQIPLVKQFAKETGVSLKLKSMQILDMSQSEKWMPSVNRFRRYAVTKGELTIKSSLPNRCMRLWFNPVITWDGKVLPCCFDKDAEYVMGDLNRDSFRSIWYGDRYMEFRRQLLTDRSKIDICNNCSSGLRGVKC